MANIVLKGLHRVTSKGRTYYYHRESGVRIRAAYGSPQFFAEFAEVEARFRNPHQQRLTSGTLAAWGQLVYAYTESPKFKIQLAERTKSDYRKVFDWLDALSDMPLDQWSRGFVVGLRDKAHTKKNWKFANHVLTTVSAVFTWAVKSDLWPEDRHPVKKVEMVKRPKDAGEANRPWEDEEWSAVTAAAPPHLLAPLLLCGLLGWREGEAIARPKTDYDPVAKTIKRVASKSGLKVETPAPARLAAALDALLPHNGITLLVNSRGRPWTEDGFRTSVFKLIRKLEADGKVEPGLTVHGLRHTVATRLREEGWDLDTIKDMLGQKTAGMAGHYSRRADLRKKLKVVVANMEK